MTDVSGPQYYPPVGFYFAVTLADTAGPAKSVPSDVDNSFQEVSGISVEYQTEAVTEGGENRFVHKLPTRTKYPNLVLKRGLVSNGSNFSDWVVKTMSANLNSPVEPKNISVSLLNEEGSPLMTWYFVNAWPVKMQVSDLQAMENKISIETMEFSFQYYETIKG